MRTGDNVILKRGYNTSYAEGLLASMVVALSLCLSSPCQAISAVTDPFSPASADQADHWIKLLRLENEKGVQVKEGTLYLLDATISAIRIESPACNDHVCLTFFKYEFEKLFEFAVACKPTFVVMDKIKSDPNGKRVFGLALDLGDNQTAVVIPTSLGPLMAVSRDTLRP